jgi:methyl-accepting chemotaxis protein
MAEELERPPTRAELNRQLIGNALLKPIPNVVVPAVVAVGGIVAGIPLIGIVVAVVAWLALSATTYFDTDEADRVVAELRGRRRAALEKRSPRVKPETLSPPVRKHLDDVLAQERRIREAIERADLPFEEVSGEVDGFVRVAERTAARAELLYEYLADEDPARVTIRLGEVRGKLKEGDESKRPLVEALTAQLEALRRAERKLEDFYTQMERVAVELGSIRGQLLSVSAASESEAQQELAAGVRDLREQVSAVAEGMSEVLETTPGAPGPSGAA